jgi:hypothetical protein
MENNILGDLVESKAPKAPVESRAKTVLMYIDPVSTDGGLWTNGTLMVGEVEVSREEASDIRRRLDEYAEVKAKLNDKDGRIHVREKNKDIITSKFCADPHEYAGKAGYTPELGTLDRRDWIAQTKEFQEYFKKYRTAIFSR